MTNAFLPTSTWHQLAADIGHLAVADLERLTGDGDSYRELLGGKVEEILAEAGVLPESIRAEVEAAG